LDARERLRQYFEQRRELGESEYVLDGLSLEDALRAIGMRGDIPPAPAGGAAGAYQPPVARPASDSPIRKAADAAAESGDWREALRAIGAEKVEAPKKAVTESASPDDASPAAEPPKEKIGRYEMPKNLPDASEAHTNAPAGLIVGAPMDELAPGPLAHLDSIDAIARAVAGCTSCSLYNGAKNPVPGEGNPNAGFVIVGEAPGATEDETGRPFVGASGELLTKILAAVNFKREDVFICNVLKHRPPGNRNPAPDEIKACSPYLLRQLELLQPRVILALGTFAAQTLLQTTTPIGKLRGQVHRYYGVPLIVTYHPAALLRNPTWKRPTWEDVQLARRVFDSAASGA
jgi:uracil-DNA glycosylase family 4